MERGDICAKYDQRVIYKLQNKDKSINPKLFTTVESNDLYGGARQGGYVPDEDGFGFEFDGGENEIVDSDASSNEEEQKTKANQKKVLKSKGKIDIDDI